MALTRLLTRSMAERGRLYLWPRNRRFGSNPRPVLVLAPDAATRHGRRWVVLPLSSEPGHAASPLAYRLDPAEANGLLETSFVMACQDTTVLVEALQGPVGRLAAADVALIAALVIEAFDLRCQQPWQES